MRGCRNTVLLQWTLSCGILLVDLITMLRCYLPVLEVREKMRGWTVLVQVVEAGDVQLTCETPPRNIMHFLLTDS